MGLLLESYNGFSKTATTSTEPTQLHEKKGTLNFVYLFCSKRVVLLEAGRRHPQRARELGAAESGVQPGGHQSRVQGGAGPGAGMGLGVVKAGKGWLAWWVHLVH